MGTTLNEYSPQETSAELFNERTLLDGAILSAAAYGVHFSLYILCTRALLSQLSFSSSSASPRSPSPLSAHRTSTYVFLVYTSCLFVLGTLFVVSSSRVAQLTFIDDRDYPGGPGVWAEEQFSIPINLLGNVCAILGTWFADALLIWRGFVIYRGSRWNWIIFGPAIMFLGSFTMSICLLVQISQPSLSLWSSLNFSLPYFTLSLSVNIVTAILITARLLFLRSRVVGVLGKDHAKQYISVVAMIIESAGLYSVFSILFLVPYALNHPIQQVFLQTLPQIEYIAPLLIIFRVAQGQAWDSRTTAMVHNRHNHNHPNNHPNGPHNARYATDTKLDFATVPDAEGGMGVSFVLEEKRDRDHDGGAMSAMSGSRLSSSGIGTSSGVTATSGIGIGIGRSSVGVVSSGGSTSIAVLSPGVSNVNNNNHQRRDSGIVENPRTSGENVKFT